MQDLNIAGFSDEKFGTDNNSGIPRRLFLKGFGIAAMTLALAPQDLLAQAGGEAKEWYDLVNNLIFSVASEPQAAAMTSQLSRASIYSVARGQASLHERYSSTFIFYGASIETQRVICDHGFQVIQLPFYDVGCPCRSRNDLNAAEIRTIIHPREIDRFNCVLAPDGQRVPLDYNDHAEYVGRAAANYRNINLEDWDVPYKRRMVGGGRAHTGYHLDHKTRRTVNGKPKTDFIVSGDI